jgi:hypothetical protein
VSERADRKQRSRNEICSLARLKRLETVRAVEQSHRPFKIEFAYLKLLPREYSGPRHRIKVGQRPDQAG